MRTIVLLIAVAATGAFAQTPLPEVAPFPLELVRASSDTSKKEREDLQKLLPMMLRAADAAVPDSARLATALTELRRADCNRDDECLAQLARLAGSLYALFAQVDFDLDGNVVVSGRLVRDDGKGMGQPQTVRRPRGKEPFIVVARAALGQLLVALEVARLSPFRPKDPMVEVPPPPLPLPEPVKPIGPTEQAVVKKTFRFPGMMAAGAGAVLVLGGGLVFTGAGSVRSDSNRNVFREDADRVAAVQTGQTIGVGLIAAGAVIGAVGVGVWLFGPEETTTTIVPMQGGAAVMLRGSFR